VSDPELPLTRLDDYPWHQTTEPFPLASTADPRFNDGYYWGFYAEGCFAYFGLRLYPNTNVMDGYGGAAVGGEQRTVRASRALRPRVDELNVGPLRLTIQEPMQRQRISVGENDSGVSFDVVVEASGPPFFEEPHVHYRRGRLLNHVLRYTQLGRAQGTITVDGSVREVERWYGVRDHSWGLRASMGPVIPLRGTEPTIGDPRAIRIWLPWEIDGQQGLFALHEDAHGKLVDFEGFLRDGDRAEVPLVSARHAFQYTPGTRRLERGTFAVKTAEGDEHEFTFEVVAGPLSPQGFGYVRGWKDKQPPGVYRGAEHVESDRFRIDDPHTVAGPDHVEPHRRLGVSEYPSILRHSDGRQGMTQIEHAVYGPYHPYGLE
jgi:hypothetical protein